VALIGRIDLFGRLLPVEGLNERVEFLFRHAGFERIIHRGQPPVIVIPSAQRDELMLAPAIVQAAANEHFHIDAVGTVNQVLEQLSGRPPGKALDGRFPEGSLLARARSRLSAERSP
jgi:predicted ATP-dependent protease